MHAFRDACQQGVGFIGDISQQKDVFQIKKIHDIGERAGKGVRFPAEERLCLRRGFQRVHQIGPGGEAAAGQNGRNGGIAFQATAVSTGAGPAILLNGYMADFGSHSMRAAIQTVFQQNAAADAFVYLKRQITGIIFRVAIILFRQRQRVGDVF